MADILTPQSTTGLAGKFKVTYYKLGGQTAMNVADIQYSHPKVLQVLQANLIDTYHKLGGQTAMNVADIQYSHPKVLQV